jgi:outer membrane cobalamin receptor
MDRIPGACAVSLAWGIFAAPVWAGEVADSNSNTTISGSYQNPDVTVRATPINPSEDDLEGRELGMVHDGGLLAAALDQEGGLEAVGISGPQAYGTISIRGASAADTLILINGQPVNQGFDLGSIPTQDIVKVETVRGPAALAYGPGAIGGAINVVTRQSQDQRWELGAGAGSFSSSQAHFSSATLSLGPWSGSLSGHWFQTQGYALNMDQSSGELDHASTLILPENTLRFTFGYTKRYGGAPYAQSLGAAGNGQFDADDRVDQWNLNSRVSDEHPLGLWTLRPQAYDNYTHVLRLNPLGLDAASGVAQANLNQYHNFGGGLEASRDFQGALAPLTLGLETKEEQLNGAYDGWHAWNNSAAYARGGWILMPGFLILDAGLRLEQYQEFGAVFVPTGTLKLFWAPQGCLYASSGEGFRAPQFDERYHPRIDYMGLLPAGYGNGEKGNPGLEPERSQSNEVGAAWDGVGVSARAAGFANFISNQISRQIDLSDGYWTYLNLSEVRILGLEADFHWQALTWLQPYSNYTYQDVRDMDRDGTVPGELRQKWVGGFRLSRGGATVDLNGKMVDRTPIQLPSDNLLNDPGSTAPAAPELPYWTLNARLDLDLGGGCRAYVDLQNIFNADYAVLPGIPMEGTDLEMGLNATF